MREVSIFRDLANLHDPLVQPEGVPYLIRYILEGPAQRRALIKRAMRPIRKTWVDVAGELIRVNGSVKLPFPKMNVVIGVRVFSKDTFYY